MSQPGQAVFLSYASQDAEAAKKICEALRSSGIEAWFDQSELRGGDAWDRKIRQQIKECALFVPIISANTQARLEGYFRLEWKLAEDRSHLMAKGKPFIVPVTVDETTAPEAHVPDSFLLVQWMRQVHGAPCTALVEQVRRLLDDGGVLRRSETREPNRVASPETSDRAKAIAVLAFANLSHDPENEYFSDGISEELLNLLAKIPGLRVTARTSSFYFKGRNVPVPEIAQKLAVGYVVEGSVRKAGNRVRIAAQLINAADGFHLWSDSFDRDLKDIFAVQDEVAALIAKNLQVKLEFVPRIAVTVDPEAYRLVLAGRDAALKSGEENLRRAENAYSGALALDPAFAPAYAGLAFVWHLRARLSMKPPGFLALELAQTEANAQKASELDATLGEPHIMLGSVALLRGRWEEARAAVARGLLLSPNSDAGRNISGFIQLNLGRPDLALVEMETALRLNPLQGGLCDPVGLALAGCGRYEEAVLAFERAAVDWPAPVVHANQALALENLGRREAAITQARAALDVTGQRGWQPGFCTLANGLAAWALAKAGQRDEAGATVQRILDGPVEHRHNAGFALLLLGRQEEALTLLRGLPPFVVFYLLAFVRENPTVGYPRLRELLVRLDALDAYETQNRILEEKATR